MKLKNDTTVAAVDVLMKIKTIVDEVQMENASNQDDGKAVDDVVSNLLQAEPIKHTLTTATTTIPPRYCCRHQTTGRDPTTIPQN
nr:hypothetical protein [Tanacetum cinerariifolium]